MPACLGPAHAMQCKWDLLLKMRIAGEAFIPYYFYIIRLLFVHFLIIGFP